jgi:Trypsin-like peptidase domain
MNIKLVIAFLLIGVSAQSQILNSEDIYDNVVLLKEQRGNMERHGTGFLIRADSFYFLVTAKHVADSLHVDVAEIFFRTPQAKTKSYKLNEFIAPKSFLKFNKNSDFFIVNLTPFDSTSRALFAKSSLDGNILANDRNSISRKTDVVVYGYPLFDLENFNPITFKSNFSSSLMNIYMPDLPKPCFCYLLENPSMAGFSGAPVFAGVKDRTTTLLEKTVVIGIVTGTTSDKTGGKFAIITPAFHLLDLLKN